MKSLARMAGAILALLSASQPSLAAAGPPPAPSAQVRLAAVSYDLTPTVGATSASIGHTLSASRQVASETEQKPRRRGPSTTTILVVGGGVLLVVLLAAAIAGAMPTPGPREGAFD